MNSAYSLTGLSIFCGIVAVAPPERLSAAALLPSEKQSTPVCFPEGSKHGHLSETIGMGGMISEKFISLLAKSSRSGSSQFCRLGKDYVKNLFVFLSLEGVGFLCI